MSQISSNDKIKILFAWCSNQINGYKNVEIKNFTTSWRNGLGFCAILHHYGPEYIDFHNLQPENVYENCKIAFEVAEQYFGIPALLDAKDMEIMTVPDRLSIITYLLQYYSTLATKKPKGPMVPGSPLAPIENISDDRLLEHKTEGFSTRESLHDQRDQLICGICSKAIYFLEKLSVKDKSYHRSCYRESQLQNLKIRNRTLERSVPSTTTHINDSMTSITSIGKKSQSNSVSPESYRNPCNTKEDMEENFAIDLENKRINSKITPRGDKIVLPSNSERKVSNVDDNNKAKSDEKNVGSMFGDKRVSRARTDITKDVEEKKKGIEVKNLKISPSVNGTEQHGSKILGENNNENMAERMDNGTKEHKKDVGNEDIGTQKNNEKVDVKSTTPTPNQIISSALKFSMDNNAKVLELVRDKIPVEVGSKDDKSWKKEPDKPYSEKKENNTQGIVYEENLPKVSELRTDKFLEEELENKYNKPYSSLERMGSKDDNLEKENYCGKVPEKHYSEEKEENKSDLVSQGLKEKESLENASNNKDIISESEGSKDDNLGAEKFVEKTPEKQYTEDKKDKKSDIVSEGLEGKESLVKVQNKKDNKPDMVSEVKESKDHKLREEISVEKSPEKPFSEEKEDNKLHIKYKSKGSKDDKLGDEESQEKALDKEYWEEKDKGGARNKHMKIRVQSFAPSLDGHLDKICSDQETSKSLLSNDFTSPSASSLTIIHPNNASSSDNISNIHLQSPDNKRVDDHFHRNSFDTSMSSLNSSFNKKRRAPAPPVPLPPGLGTHQDLNVPLRPPTKPKSILKCDSMYPEDLNPFGETDEKIAAVDSDKNPFAEYMVDEPRHTDHSQPPRPKPRKRVAPKIPPKPINAVPIGLPKNDEDIKPPGPPSETGDELTTPVVEHSKKRPDQGLSLSHKNNTEVLNTSTENQSAQLSNSNQKPEPLKRKKFSIEMSKSNDELNLIGTSKPKPPAPPRPPPQKRKVRGDANEEFIPYDLLYKELKEVNEQQSDMENKGRSIQIALNEVHEDDERYEGLLQQWLEIVENKNLKYLREHKLHEILRRQELEDRHSDLEFELRVLMGKQESLKTAAEKVREDELLNQILDTVNARAKMVEEDDESIIEKSIDIEEPKKKGHLRKMFSTKTRSNSVGKNFFHLKFQKNKSKTQKSIFYEQK